MSEQWIGGIHAVEQALESTKVLSLKVASKKASKKLTALLALAQEKGVGIEYCEFYQLDQLLFGVRHQGVAALCRFDGAQYQSWQDAIAGKEKPLILILDSIQDPHNLGACLRSALAAKVDAVLLPNSRAADLNATVHKVSCGASEILPIFKVANLRQELSEMQEKGIWAVAGVGGVTTSYYDLDLNTGLAIVVGNEAEGIRQSLQAQCDYQAQIPMYEAMESLNVSVACAIMLFEAQRQRGFSF